MSHLPKRNNKRGAITRLFVFDIMCAMGIHEIKHFDTPLLRFSIQEDGDGGFVEILWRNQKARDLFPLDLEVSGDGIFQWLKRRTIPKNRAYVQSLLSKCGLSLNRPIDIIRLSKGLSLTDCYWVVEDGFSGRFADFNLYDNRFSQILALIAFTGYGSRVRTSLISCPEFTTNGMLPKCWRRIDGKIKLYKGGTSGASNTGKEPYSEYYASQVAQALGIDAVSYSLSKWQGVLCSVCDLFTSKNYSFLPVGRVVTSGGLKAVRQYYEKLGPKFVKALDEMLVFDALVFNSDRHFGNFGFLVDNKTNKIVKPAPLFDHGNSLFNFAGRDDLASDVALDNYAKTLLPCVTDDFLSAAKSCLSKRQKESLRRFLAFKFKKHSRYNLPAASLHRIEKQIQKQAKKLID